MMDWAKLVRDGLERSEKTATLAHPDPDLLAAFAEQSISEPEQRSVLGHLAGCASCRAVVYLAQPEAALPTADLQPQPSLWTRWLVVRWAAAAAVVVVVAGTVMLYRGNQAKPQQVATLTETSASQPAAAQNAAAPAPAPAADKRADVSSETVAAKRALETTVARNQAAATPALDTATTFARTKPSAPAVPPVLTATRNVPVPELQAQAAEPARVAVVPSAREIEGPITPLVPPNVIVLDRPTQVLASTSTQASDNSQSSGLFFVGRTGAPPSLERPNKSRTFTIAGKAERNSQAGFSAGAVQKAWTGTNLTHVRWSTTGTGQLQRSGDGMRWQPVTVAEGVIFQSVDEGGSEVWAGGTGGVLYHSRDDGATWSKVAVVADAETLHEDITSVSFRQPGSITVRTASSATWVSVDGGLHWALHR